MAFTADDVLDMVAHSGDESEIEESTKFPLPTYSDSDSDFAVGSPSTRRLFPSPLRLLKHFLKVKYTHYSQNTPLSV